MGIFSINQLQDVVMKMFERIPYHNGMNFFISFKENNYDCMPFISIDKEGYHLKCYERGKIISDYTTLDLNDFLYCIFQEITFEEACMFELKNRVKYKDTRRLMFSKQLELLKYVSDDFANRRELEIDKILQATPFNDNYSSIFDLIDNFEGVAKDIYEIYQREYVYENHCEHEIKSIIDKVSELHREGTSDILKFCKDISEEIKMIYSQLKNADNLNLDVKVQLEKIEDTLKIAEKVFNNILEANNTIKSLNS